MDIANGSSSNNASNALASLASLHQLMSFSLVPMSCTYMKAMATRLVQCILQNSLLSSQILAGFSTYILALVWI